MSEVEPYVMVVHGVDAGAGVSPAGTWVLTALLTPAVTPPVGVAGVGFRGM